MLEGTILGIFRYSTGDASCDEYNGTCDVTSGFRCVRFDDVRMSHNGVCGVQCVCTLGVDECRHSVTQHDTGPHTSSSVSDVIADVTDDDDDDDDDGDDDHSQWLLTHRHTDHLIGKHVDVIGLHNAEVMTTNSLHSLDILLKNNA